MISCHPPCRSLEEISVKFCDLCSSRLKVKQFKEGGKTVLRYYCPKCNKVYDSTNFGSPEVKKEENRPIKILSDAESKIETMPTIEIECPKCNNNRSYWWLLQTRSGDEPPTQFYRCTKCGYTWRMYA